MLEELLLKTGIENNYISEVASTVELKEVGERCIQINATKWRSLSERGHSAPGIALTNYHSRQNRSTSCIRKQYTFKIYSIVLRRQRLVIKKAKWKCTVSNETNQQVRHPGREKTEGVRERKKRDRKQGSKTDSDKKEREREKQRLSCHLADLYN